MHHADDHTFVFIGGLNRSGTTLLTRALGQHPLVSSHDLFEEDRALLAHLHVVTFEDLITEPGRCVADIHRFLELEPHAPALDLRPGSNSHYFEQWHALRARPVGRLRIAAAERHHENVVRRHGYSLTDLAQVPD